MGSSAYDLDRWGALPEIEIAEEPRRRERPEEALPPPGEEVRRQGGAKTRARTQAQPQAQVHAVGRRQTVSTFGVFGCLVVGALLLLIVLSHMQLAVISSEMAQLEGRISTLREDGLYLQGVHENAFSAAAVERFAREELGMVEAVQGQMVFIGGVITGDVAEVLRMEEAVDYGLLDHVAGFVGTLRASWGSIFGA